VNPQGAARPAFVWLAVLQNPPHKPVRFVQGVPVARIQEHCSYPIRAPCNPEVSGPLTRMVFESPKGDNVHSPLPRLLRHSPSHTPLISLGGTKTVKPFPRKTTVHSSRKVLSGCRIREGLVHKTQITRRPQSRPTCLLTVTPGQITILPLLNPVRRVNLS
jgi:hypothetical protein